MLKFSLSILLIVLLRAIAFPQVFEKHPAGKGLYGYYLYLPKAYDSKPGDLFPLLIAFHGVGEGGSGSESDLNKLTSTGIPKLLASGSWPTDRPFIVLCPQSSQGFYNPEIIKSTISHITKTYRADANRIYMTGFSAGAISIWNDLNDHYKHIAAAVVPVSGARNRAYDVCNVKDVPLWAFHGEADPNGPTPAGGTIKNVNAINDCVPAPNPKAKATIYPGVGHNAWDITYNLKGMSSSTKYDPYDVDIYSWLLQHSLDKSDFAIASFLSSPASVLKDQSTTIRFTAIITGEASAVTVNLTSLGGNVSHTLTRSGAQYYIDYIAPADLSTGSKTIILTAVDGKGQTVTKSLNIIVQENKYIAPPENLKSIPEGTGRIRLEWNDKSSNEEGFVIESKEAGQAFFNALQTVSENITNYTASNLKCNASYEFRVKAINDAGESAYSNISTSSTLSLAAPAISPSGETVFCEGESVKIVTAQDYAGYLWSNNANVKTITVTQSGTYRLKVKDAEGCWSGYSNSVNVTVHPLPTKPAINYENGQVLCPGSPTKLTAPSGYDQYLWSTGATSESIEVTKEGSYSVSVATGECWSPVSSPASVTYKSKPVKPSLNYTGKKTLCNGETVSLKAPDGFQYYQWSNGAKTNAITVSQSGGYTVQVANCPGEWSPVSEPLDLTFNPTPSKPAIDYENGQVLCSGSPTKLTAPSGYDQYLWSTGATSESIEVTKEGSYSVSVATGECWSPVSSLASVTYKSKPGKPSLNYTGKKTLCNGETVSLKAPDGFQYYQWSNGAKTNAITVSQTGGYTVQVANCPGEWSPLSEPMNLTFNPAPSKPAIDFDNKSYCKGETAILSIRGKFQEYTWSNQSKESEIKVTTTGKYSVKVKNEFNCWSKSSNQVEVVFKEPASQPVIESTPEIHLCKGEKATLSISGEYDRYLWSTGETTPTIEIMNSGVYSVKTSNCTEIWSESSEIVTAIIHSPAIPSITIHQDTLFTDEYAGYQWYNNGISITGATDQYIVPNTASYYSVKVIDHYGCNANSISRKFTPEKYVIKVYPNPTTGTLFVKFNSPNPYHSIVSIKNVHGKTMYTKTGFERSYHNGIPLEIDISHFDKGMYLLYLYNGEWSIKEKIILQ